MSNLSKETVSFDADLARLSEIRELDTWGTQRGKDIPFLLSFVDKLWAEYCSTLAEADGLRRHLDLIALKAQADCL